jgi:hypothetical protein
VKIRLSHSAIQDFLRCPRRWYMRWVLGVNAVGPLSRPLDVGRAFHAGQEVWWTGTGEIRDRVQAARQAFTDASSPDLSWEDSVLGPVLLTAYAARYSYDELRFHGVPVAERKVVMPVLHPDSGLPDPDLEYTVVFDVVGYDSDASTVLVEHKTTSSDIMTANFWGRFDTSLQLPLQMMAAHDSGRDASKLVVDVVRVPNLRRAKATPIERREFYKRATGAAAVGDPKPGTRLRDETREEFEIRVAELVMNTPDAFFARREYLPSERMFTEARRDLWSVGQQMLAVARAMSAARNPEGCAKYGSVCEYEPVCWKGAALDDATLYARRERRDVNQG